MGEVIMFSVISYFVIGIMLGIEYYIERDNLIDSFIVFFFWLPIIVFLGLFEFILSIKRVINNKKTKKNEN